jgi:hypothetical protein
MNSYLPVLCCFCLLGTSCTPNTNEVVSVPSLEGTWRNYGTAYQYYDAKHKLISRDTMENKSLGSMVITSTFVQLYRDGGTSMEEPWPYERHGDTIQFIGGGGYWTIVQLTPKLLVTRVEMAYPFADKTDTARYAFIDYNIR